MYNFYFCFCKQVKSICKPVFFCIDHSFYPSLYYKLGAFYAWSISNV